MSFLDKSYFEDIKGCIVHNSYISEFYRDKFHRSILEDTIPDFKFKNKSDYIDSCCRYFLTDTYFMQRIKVLNSVNLCRDKFCFNCQTVLSARRQLRFGPVLDSYRNDFDIYHIAFTLPNCYSDELPPTLDRMYRHFQFLVRFLSGRRKVKGVDFLQYGYIGCVRGTEVSYNKSEYTYHPHFHAMFVLRKGLNFTGKHINDFSFSKNSSNVWYFSDFEILLQKVWYLLLNGIKVTADSISQLKQGYSVKVVGPITDGNYHECFKYACKGAFKKDEGLYIYIEPVFWTLYEALSCRRMIQGYGVLHNIKDNDDEDFKLEVDEELQKVISELQIIEKPFTSTESIDEILGNYKQGYKYCSKYSIADELKKRREDERK